MVTDPIGGKSCMKLKLRIFKRIICIFKVIGIWSKDVLEFQMVKSFIFDCQKILGGPQNHFVNYNSLIL